VHGFVHTAPVSQKKLRRSYLRFAAFGLLSTGSVYTYLALRIVGPSPLTGWARASAYLPFLVAWSLGPIAFSVRRRTASRDWRYWVMFSFNLSGGLLLMLFALVAIRDAGWWLVVLANAIGDLGWLPDARAARAALLHQTTLVVLILLVAEAAYGYWSTQRTPGVKRVSVPIEGLHSALEGFRIVQLSDIHLGANLDGAYLAKVVAVANGLQADLVAVTGDLVDGRVEQLLPEAEPLLDLSSRHGTFFVTGNHEYYSDAPPWIAALRGLGLPCLINEHVVLEHAGAQIVLAGVTDPSAKAFVPDQACDPSAAFEGAPEGDLRLLLAHQPRTVSKTDPALAVARQLSGHTHGGQIFPFQAMVMLQQPMVAGLKRFGKSWVYTSRGTGYWGPPFRVLAPSEITLIEVKGA